jgi:hypothetical protein
MLAFATALCCHGEKEASPSRGAPAVERALVVVEALADTLESVAREDLRRRGVRR